SLARTLAESEARIAARCAAQGVACTILRPTLIHDDDGADRSLARIAALAWRAGFFVLPAGARGLRAPVHADDVAAAVVACAATGASANRAYDLPGGENVDYREMVARVLATLSPKPRLVTIPDLVARPALRLAARLAGASPALVDRLYDDLVFDAGPARRDFGYAPRGFAPGATT
ncbi:MAG TPA: nucleoside-diphosphate sugar epimerase, partial [Candidatus Saccharimonadia bacterium]|nr:nucleoside-diphosphate sugar epimerase [Candidatus Saccharimonadia bacterium]